jgi:hypothetical protein
MAYTNAEKFNNLGMAFPLADAVGTAIDETATSANPNITALVALTNSTGEVGNNTVAAVPDATAASTDTSAASLTSTNASILALNQGLADLTDKVNAIIAALKA